MFIRANFRMAPRRRGGRRRRSNAPIPVMVEPIAVRSVQSLQLDWNEAGQSTISRTLPASLNGYSWRLTSIAITIASPNPAPFVIRLYGGLNSGVTQSAVEITARSRTLLSCPSPQQIFMRNSRHVQHANTDSEVYLAQIVPGSSGVTITVCGVIRLSILGSF